MLLSVQVVMTLNHPESLNSFSMCGGMTIPRTALVLTFLSDLLLDTSEFVLKVNFFSIFKFYCDKICITLKSQFYAILTIFLSMQFGGIYYIHNAGQPSPLSISTISNRNSKFCLALTPHFPFIQVPNHL